MAQNDEMTHERRFVSDSFSGGGSFLEVLVDSRCAVPVAVAVSVSVSVAVAVAVAFTVADGTVSLD